MSNIIITSENKNLDMNQREVWDSISNQDCDKRKKPFFKVEEFLLGKNGKILDLGCGSGRNMVSGDFEYYGVDFSKKHIRSAKKIAKEKNIKAKFFELDAENLDKNIFRDEMFDYGLFIGTLHCLESADARENALKGFYRVLKNGGEGLISVWNSEDKRFNGLKGEVYMSWKKEETDYMRFYYIYEKNEFIDLLKKTGFKIMDIFENDSYDRFSKKNLIVRVKK
ncbi:MAG: class I SAM-dependent methyltransferase [Candidatus Nanoarchaeia archaeon]|nr:class I SAM-dependent methyltransferase [Candidatus Nanoarchaeia archaeon]